MSRNWLIVEQILKSGLCRDPKILASLKRYVANPSESNLRALSRRTDPEILHRKIFCPPYSEPDERVNGLIRFARTAEGMYVGINLDEYHILIVGMTNCGKTILLILILGQAIQQGAIVWVFAKAKDVRNLLLYSKEIINVDFRGQIKFNPLVPPPGVDVRFWINVFSDIFIQSHGLFDGTKNYLLDNINFLFSKNDMPTIHDLYRLIKAKKYSQYARTARYQESALNRLEGMIASMGNTLTYPCIALAELAKRNAIFDIQGLTSEQQIFVTNILLTWLFYYKLYHNDANYHFVGIDDAQLVFDRSFEYRPDHGLPIISHLISTVRKSKVHVLVAGQIPSQLGSSIHANSFAKIMFSLAYGKDIECMAQSMGLSNVEQIQYCHRLGLREILVKFSGRYQEPFLAHVPEVQYV